ncbi:MAG: DUF721 domain-containing protein [Scytolyngbya sp. HA4215-MV1]|jgi:predicted nucleic acid-binding Zn ribbon protein|nr:DUF721 domain-containing protein [Scytolyngbya sp. HA4215-MV1]
MSLKSLHDVLGSLENHYKRADQQQFQHLLQCWSQVVGSVVAAQTRPLSIYRGILKVATASSVWSQNLSFERQRILEKLNAQLATPLVDIRFSAARWDTQQDIPASNGSDLQDVLWQNHPSRIHTAGRSTKLASLRELTDPNAAFQFWAERIKRRSQHLPLCPRCSCPTPPGELQRWSLCSLCAAKRW